MKIFISWSGETASALAALLRDWLPKVIQVLKPYSSTADIAPGTRWASEISVELEQSHLGLLCLTTDNLEAPWVMFEAGALSKHVGVARVCPLLFGVKPTDLKGPLVQFQSVAFGKDGMRELLRTINIELGDKGISDAVLDSAFDTYWPTLEASVAAVLQRSTDPRPPAMRTERELLEEVLSLTRALSWQPIRREVKPVDGISGILDIVVAACRVGNFEFEYVPQKGPFTVLCRTAGTEAFADFDCLHNIVRGLRDLYLTGDERKVVEAMNVRLYQIYHELQGTISRPPSTRQGT